MTSPSTTAETPAPTTTGPDDALAASLTDPRVTVGTYVVHPTGYDDMANPRKAEWRLIVTPDGDDTWCIRPGYSSHRAKLHATGTWVSDFDSARGRRKPKLRWPLDRALAIALRRVDTHQWMDSTAFEADAIYRARRTPAPPGWTTELDGEDPFPFVEDEHGFITGYGHQHRAEFAEHVNRYLDATGNPVDEDDRCEPSHVSWLLVVQDETNDETLRDHVDGKPVTWSTPGAIPVTAVWHLN